MDVHFPNGFNIALSPNMAHVHALHQKIFYYSDLCYWTNYVLGRDMGKVSGTAVPFLRYKMPVIVAQNALCDLRQARFFG